MVKRKSGEKEMEIAEVLGFIKSMKRGPPSGNQIPREFLDEKERVLYKNLFNWSFDKFNDVKEDV